MTGAGAPCEALSMASLYKREAHWTGIHASPRNLYWYLDEGQRSMLERNSTTKLLSFYEQVPASYEPDSQTLRGRAGHVIRTDALEFRGAKRHRDCYTSPLLQPNLMPATSKSPGMHVPAPWCWHTPELYNDVSRQGMTIVAYYPVLVRRHLLERNLQPSALRRLKRYIMYHADTGDKICSSSRDCPVAWLDTRRSR